MTKRVDRRTFLKYSAAVGAGTSAATMLGLLTPLPPAPRHRNHHRWTTSRGSTYDHGSAGCDGVGPGNRTVDHTRSPRSHRADRWAGPRVNSIIEVNPDAEAIAASLDQERASGHIRGPLHGIPIVLKDVIATADRMQTTAGSLALVGSTVPRDAGVASRLCEAGAILLGKANLSEWNAFRGFPSRGVWSARAGIGRNPYALNFGTGDSSSGSAAAVAASFAAGAVGLETYGSIVMPSSLCGVVGLKPTAD